MLAYIGGILIAAGTARAQLNEGQYYLRTLPDVPIVLVDGSKTTLHRLFQSQSVILTLFSAHCGGLCSAYLLYLRQALGSTPTGFRVVVLSFDPRDTLADVRVLTQRLALAEHPSWQWGVMDPEQIPRLLAGLGYALRYDPTRNDYDHSIVVFVVDRQGNILRRMEGFQDPALLKDLVREARGNFVFSYPLPATDVALRCFDFDKETGTWRLSWGMALLLLPPVSSLAIALLLRLLVALEQFRAADSSS